MAAPTSETEADSVISILAKLQKDCGTPLKDLKEVVEAMANSMRAGLAGNGGNNLPMIPSHVDNFPTGNEQGLYYALDLGGTNFRVLRVLLGGENQVGIHSEAVQVQIPEKLMSGTSKDLFDFMASGLARFVETENGNFHLANERKREIGFTFSFPVEQTSINSGILTKWTKGFNIPEAIFTRGVDLNPAKEEIGKDVVVCLNKAIKAQGLNMRVSALVNDTVGALARAKYHDDDAMVAVILGTGTNACYVERIDAIPKLKGHSSSSGRMIINTEWGAFEDGLLLTQFDKDMDGASNNPGEQIFEKKISGMYLGEIVRRVLVKMAEEESLFRGYAPNKLLSTPFKLETEDIKKMQQDESKKLAVVGLVLREKAEVESNLDERKVVKEVIDAVVKRGARLAGAGIVGILQKMENDSPSLIFGNRKVVVAVEGGLYENYPQYKKYLQDAVTELVTERVGEEISNNIKVEQWKDGSGIGAALLAATNKQGFYCMDFIELLSSCCVC